MRDVGDTVRLQYTVRDANDAPVNPAAVTLQIRRPDGTTVTPSVDLPVDPVGELVHDYVVADHGRHVVLWQTSGPATAHVDVFNAAGADWPAIVGLTETKKHLGIPLDDTSDDDELRGFILSASMVVEDVVGAVARRTITETASGGGRHIVLERPPVAEVLEVRVDGVLVDAGEYTPSPSGLLASRYGVWPDGLRNVEITYVAGRVAARPNVINATLELLRINWRPQQGGNYSAFDGGRADDFAPHEGTIRLGFFVPNTVMERLHPDRRGPVAL